MEIIGLIMKTTLHYKNKNSNVSNGTLKIIAIKRILLLTEIENYIHLQDLILNLNFNMVELMFEQNFRQKEEHGQLYGL